MLPPMSLNIICQLIANGTTLFKVIVVLQKNCGQLIFIIYRWESINYNLWNSRTSMIKLRLKPQVNPINRNLHCSGLPSSSDDCSILSFFGLCPLSFCSPLVSIHDPDGVLERQICSPLASPSPAMFSVFLTQMILWYSNAQLLVNEVEHRSHSSLAISAWRCESIPLTVL